MVMSLEVVVATTKVRIFKQITTVLSSQLADKQLLLLPQRYVFSSKSQLDLDTKIKRDSCCCYHKGTYFQANHNGRMCIILYSRVVVATTKVRIFKQITTGKEVKFHNSSCCCYHKGTYFQANHNTLSFAFNVYRVVVATTKVRIFKQITTIISAFIMVSVLLLLPQRYVFSSKSQQIT